MENKTNVRPIRVRYAGKALITQYGVHLEGAEMNLETAISRALGVKEGDKPLDFLGEITIIVRPLEGTGLMVEEVSGE